MITETRQPKGRDLKRCRSLAGVRPAQVHRMSKDILLLAGQLNDIRSRVDEVGVHLEGAEDRILRMLQSGSGRGCAGMEEKDGVITRVKDIVREGSANISRECYKVMGEIEKEIASVFAGFKRN